MDFHRAILGLVLALWGAPIWAQGNSPGGPTNWIDVHSHLIGIDGGSAGLEGAVQVAISRMDEAAIDRILVMPPPMTWSLPPGNRLDHARLREVLKPHGKRFGILGGGGILNPMLARAPAGATPAALESFAREAEAIAESGVVGFGEISLHHLSLGHGHPYQWTQPDHPLMLKLVEVAARHGLPIDLHLDPVGFDMDTPPRLRQAFPANPPKLAENLQAFERLLAHDRRVKFIWAHAGSDPMPYRSPARIRQWLERHPNLYMSLRFPSQRPPNSMAPPQHAFDANDQPISEWVELVATFPERFVIGGDLFFNSPSKTVGPTLDFARSIGRQFEMTRKFLAALPADVALKVARTNVETIYRLGPR